MDRKEFVIGALLVLLAVVGFSNKLPYPPAPAAAVPPSARPLEPYIVVKEVPAPPRPFIWHCPYCRYQYTIQPPDATGKVGAALVGQATKGK